MSRQLPYVRNYFSESIYMKLGVRIFSSSTVKFYLLQFVPSVELNVFFELSQKLSQMSKSKKNKKVPTKIEEATASNDNGPIQTDKSGNLVIQILAKPGAKQNQITDISQDGIHLSIAAPPGDFCLFKTIRFVINKISFLKLMVKQTQNF